MTDIRYEKLQELTDLGKNPHAFTSFHDRTYARTIKEDFENWDGKTVRMAGRIMARRGHGKVQFIDMQDATGRIQLFMKKDLLEDTYDELKLLDIGDIVGVEGEIFKTHAGEVSLRATSYHILTKSLRILPEKWHGLKDPDLRYRRRYVDLIVNPNVKETFVLRSKIIRAVRRFLDDRGFLEVETPILNTIVGGANARPFVTHHNTLDIPMYMRIANELYLKRLIVGGFDKVYEMGRMFRNEGMDHTHNPEYTAIELYEAYADYEDMMKITEELVAYVAQEVHGTTVIEYEGKKIDLTPPWRRLSMTDALKEFAGIDFDKIETDEEAQAVAAEHHVELKKGKTRGFVIDAMFEALCEEHLIQPIFCVTTVASGYMRLNSSVFFPPTRIVSSTPDSSSAPVTYEIMGFPRSGKSTLERLDFMRVPSPAANTIAFFIRAPFCKHIYYTLFDEKVPPQSPFSRRMHRFFRGAKGFCDNKKPRSNSSVFFLFSMSCFNIFFS